MAQACKLVHHAHEAIPFQKQAFLAQIIAQTWNNFMSYVAN